MMPTATPIEVLYTAIILAGATCNAWCLWDAVQDRRVVVSRVDCGEMGWLIAHGNVRGEVVRLLVQVSILGVGILSLYLPPIVDRELPTALESFRILVRVQFIYSTVLLAIHSILSVRDRRRILYLNRHFSDDDGRRAREGA